MSDTPTQETDAQGFGDGRHPWVATSFARKLERERDEANHELNKKYIEYDKLFDVAELIKTERDQILDALMKIEEIFIDGADTYNDWLAMGSIARAALEKLNK
jgi:hypothetical protein